MNSFKETLLKSNLPSIIQDVGEISIDSMLPSGLFQEIPVLGTITSICNTFGSVRDYFFAKNMMRFLQSISSMSEDERRSLVRKLDSDPEFGEYAGERIISLLSRIDDEKKPLLIAKALKLYAESQITSSELQRAHNAIDKFQMCDLQELKEFSQENSKPRATDGNAATVNFINSGLAYVSSGYGGGGVHPTDTAKLLSEIANSCQL